MPKRYSAFHLIEKKYTHENHDNAKQSNIIMKSIIELKLKLADRGQQKSSRIMTLKCIKQSLLPSRRRCMMESMLSLSASAILSPLVNRMW